MGFFDKIKAGLTKTRAALSDTLGSVFTASEIDDDFYDELEESLILADLGMDTAVRAVSQLRQKVRSNSLKTAEEAREALKEILVDMLSVGETALDLSTTPSVILVIGVNGVGKTTTIGKMSKQLIDQGTQETYSHNIIALLLVHAPEDDQRCHQKSSFLTQLGDQKHKFIQCRKAQTFQEI